MRRWDGIWGSDSFLGIRDEGSQAGVPPKMTRSGRGVEGTSGIDDRGVGFDGSLIGGAFRNQRVQLF